MENELELQDAQENLEEVAETSEVEQSTDNSDLDSVKEQLEQERKSRLEYEAKMKHWRDKAQKLEKAKPVQEKADEPAKTDGMSLKDIRALQDVHDEDVDEVINYAKFKGISIAEAKKDIVISSMLKTKEELRKTADATNTGKSKRGSSSLSPEQIYESALSGKEVDPAKLAEAMHDLRKRKVIQL